MTTSERGPNRIRIDQVRVGLYIKLDSWLGHPFLFSAFKVRNEEQIAALKSMGLTDIEYVPAKSDCPPGPPPADPSTKTIPPGAQESAALEALMHEKKARIEALNRERERVRAAERKYVKTANSVKNVMRLANNNPAQAAQLSGEVADEFAELFTTEQNPYIHLMGDNVADESAYFHSVNVTVLSLILARALGVSDRDTLREIAQGAVLHDVGKALVPGPILLKDEELSAPEMKLFQMHPAYGIKLMQAVPDLPKRVREIILFHHELCDGSGYPKGVQANSLDQAVRIVTIANAYDNLCNPRVLKRARTPSEALSHLFKNEAARYDKTALPAFIKSLGVYPPGTIVKLVSGRIGIVMTVDPADLLNPNLMIYDPEIPKDDAPSLHLKRDLDDRIERTLRPAALPEAVHDYLSPRKRICYFVDHAGAS